MDPGEGIDLQETRLSRRWQPFTKNVVLIIILLGAALALFRFSSILPPTIIACLLAYVLAPLITGLQRRARIPRALGILLVYLVLLGVVSLLPILFFPSLAEQVEDLQLDLEGIAVSTVGWLGSVEISLFGFSIDIESLYNQIGESLKGLFSPAATGAFSLVVNVATTVIWVIYVLLVAFYLLLDAPRLREYFPGLLPPQHRDELLRLVDEIDLIWRGFLRGQLILSLVMGGVVTAVTAALGLSNALALGLLAAVLEFLPNIGPVLAAIPAVLLALFQGSSYLPLTNWAFALVVIGAYLVIQQLENAILMPRIIGRSVRLHPLVIIVGIVLGASLAGILGIFLAAPTLASLRVLLRYAYRKLLDMEPFGEGLAPLEEELVPYRALVGGELVEAIFFDLDGTLIETDDALAGQAMGEEGGARRSLTLGAWRAADRAHRLLDRVGLDDEADRLREWLSEQASYLPDVTEVPPVEGMRETLQQLSRRYRLALLTTRTRREAIRWLEHHGLVECFAVVTTNDDVRHRKPDPEGILRTAEELKVAVNRCAVVGDTTEDLEAARQAGALSIAVMGGLGDEEELARADMQVASMAELPDILT